MAASLSYSHLSPPTRLLWAKSGETQGHGLLAHMLDVAAVVEAILAREPPTTRQWAGQALGWPEAEVSRWLAALVGLHDFGKAIPGFQAKWDPGWQRLRAAGLSAPERALRASSHALATASLLGPVLSARVAGDLRWLRAVLQAISAHHGYHFLPSETAGGCPRGEPPAWAAARAELLSAYWSTLAPPGEPRSTSLPLSAVNWLAGLTSVADWIASNVAWFPLGERADDLPGHLAAARTLAEAALDTIGWHASRSLLAPTDARPVDALIAQMVDRPGLTARPLQQAGDRLLQQVSGPCLMLVEAPMGEGKTELAFLAHLRLQGLLGHRGLYVALPTQATGNALFSRAHSFLAHFSAARVDIQLVHGGAAMNEELRHLQEIDHSPDESVSASAWFGQRRRPLLSPYGVGTVDQALYGVLNVKHHFVRLWGLANRVVVLDEVHAYDSYTSGLIVALLRWLRSLGCSVVLMSATLPRARRDELIRAWGAEAHDWPALDYPRVALVDAQSVRGLHFGARPLAPITLQGLAEDVAALAAQAQALLAQGGCGAVIVNTVDRAQQLYRQLREALGPQVPVLLFHARFPMEDRQAIETQVLQCFGPDGARPTQALLVATQVAEQSLDIDFDFMLSDLAPVDLLLQRAGRLHRHTRARPAAHTQARLWVAGLVPGRLPELKKTAWGFVYEPYILCRTWALLTQESTLQLPQDIDRLVQAVYDIDTPLPEGLQTAVQDFIEISSYGAYVAGIHKQRTESRLVAIDPADVPEDAYAHKPRGHEEEEGGIGLENRTRQGQEAVTLVPVAVLPDGRWQVRAGGPLFAPDQALDDATARALYARQLKVSRVAVVKHIQAQQPPAAFSGHPLLKYLQPLPLRDGRCAIGRLQLCLDEALGLVYEQVALPATPPEETA